MWFFLVDAFEDDRVSPPRVYLFGKVHVKSGRTEHTEYRSCCLVVEKLERCFHLLLKVEDPMDVEAAKSAAHAASEELQKLCADKIPNMKVLRCKLKWRNYAFEKPLAQGLGNLPFLKVVCDAAGSMPPVGLAGDTFTHSFGIQTSLLERLLLTRRLMGPAWYRLRPGSFREEAAKLSHCATEFRITPASIQVAKTEAERQQWGSHSPSSSPPLRVLSLSLQTFQQSAQMPHEVLAIGCSLHPTVSPDASVSESDLQSSRSKWAAVRRLDGNPFPRDAEKAQDLESRLIGSACCFLLGQIAAGTCYWRLPQLQQRTCAAQCLSAEGPPSPALSPCASVRKLSNFCIAAACLLHVGAFRSSSREFVRVYPRNLDPDSTTPRNCCPPHC